MVLDEIGSRNAKAKYLSPAALIDVHYLNELEQSRFIKPIRRVASPGLITRKSERTSPVAGSRLVETQNYVAYALFASCSAGYLSHKVFQ